MRYAIISDVHANEAALRSVLTDAADMQAEKIVCLGDVLGYGPDPVSALELVYRRAHVCLAGNHDDAVAGRFGTEDFSEFAASAVVRHRKSLHPKALDWLRHLPYTCEFEGFACAHGDFSDPRGFNYVLEPAEAMPSWQTRTEQLLFVGHTHKSGIFVLGRSGEPHALEAEDFVLEDGKRYIVNPGSVGYPRSGVCRSSYCIYDDETRAVYFRTLPFDLEAYAAKMRGQGLNEAPWMKHRACDQHRPEVRNAEVFGRKVVAPKKTIRTQPISLPSGKEETLSWKFVLVIVALILAVAGLMCTMRLIDALPKKDVAREVARVAVAETPMVKEGAELSRPRETSTFRQTQPLASGWTAALENPHEQRVRIEHNDRKNETVFRMEHLAFHTIRFSKRVPLMSKPERLYYAVKLLTPARPGEKEEFQFTTCISFEDAEGRLVGEFLGSGKQSRKDHCLVPPTAVRAEFTVDCRFHGIHDLDVPYIGIEPMRESRRKAGK